MYLSETEAYNHMQSLERKLREQIQKHYTLYSKRRRLANWVFELPTQELRSLRVQFINLDLDYPVMKVHGEDRSVLSFRQNMKRGIYMHQCSGISISFHPTEGDAVFNWLMDNFETINTIPFWVDKSDRMNWLTLMEYYEKGSFGPISMWSVKARRTIEDMKRNKRGHEL